MEIDTIKIIIYVLIGGTILFTLIRLANRPKKCDICGAEKSNDYYINESCKYIVLCRNHLAENWKKDIKSSKYTMMVIEPDFNTYPGGYMYANTKELKEWQYPESAENNINSILDKISGNKCRECGETATVAYFKKDDYEFPNMENIKADPTYLCKSCTSVKVAPLILSAPKAFSEGIMYPGVDRGVYHVQEF